MSKTGLSFILLAVFILSAPQKALSDELSDLKAEIQKVQEENKTLQEELKRQNELTERLLNRVEAMENKNETLSKEVKVLKERPIEPVAAEETEFEEASGVPELKLKGFADMGFSAKVTDNGDNTSFSRGQLDLFITSEITDKISFLAEPVFESDADTNSQEFELERAELKYSFSDLLNIKIGRMHTPLGYWNQAFHHGTWLQTTIFRPEVYNFEDLGGILPVHSVGIEMLGTKSFDPFDLDYNLGILNGRGRTRTTIQNAKDENDSKAINALIGLRPYFIEGLKIGANIYYDKIPSNPTVSTRTSRIDELILGGHLIYLHNNLELMGEFFDMRHEDKTSGRDFDTTGLYLQAGYKVNKLTPYYRFDFIDFGDGDPYFVPDDFDIKRHTLGLRWDAFTWNALKFEYSFSDKKRRDDEHLVTANSSFTF